MQSKIRLLVLLGGSVVTAAAWAHHSPAMLYDLSKEVDVEGVVTKYVLGNPHLRVYFDVEKDGEVEHWLAEGGSRTVLMRKGWDGTELRAGDRITIRGNPTRDGSKVVHLEYLTLPDGTELYGEDLNNSALEDLRRRRRQ